MNVEQVDSNGPSLFGRGYKISDWSTVDELLAFRDEKRSADPATQLLFILDDPNQAEYTSYHAVDTHDLKDVSPNDLPPDERAVYEEKYDLTEARVRSLVAAALLRLADNTTFDVDQRLIPIDAEEVELLEAYENPQRAFGSPAYCLETPGEEPSLAIAALPNGYFRGDLDPGENYLLAEQLRQSFGYEIVGLGSCLAAYVRPEPVNLDEAKEVVASVAGLYMKFNDEHAAAWAAATADRRLFLLHYRGH